MSVKENVFNDRKNRYEEFSRFRNGDITQQLVSILKKWLDQAVILLRYSKVLLVII